MNRQPRTASRRAGPLFGVLMIVVGALAALTPVVPAARALDPTPDPSVTEPSPAPTPDPTAMPDPTATPAPEASPDPTAMPAPEASAEPTAMPAPEASPEPTPTPTPFARPTLRPLPTVEPRPTPTPGPSGEPSPEPSVAPSPSPSPTPGPSSPAGIEVAHTWLDQVDAWGKVVDGGDQDADLARMERFTVYRIRFQVLNTGDTAIDLQAALEAGIGSSPDSWALVPAVDPVAGRPFYVASDDGRVFRARSAQLATPAQRLDIGPAPDYAATPGVSSSGVNPTPTITLPPRSFTEVEFAVRATVNAAWTQAYAFRLRPAGGAPAAGAPAVVTMRPKPAIELTVPPSATAAAQPAVRYQLAVANVPVTGPTYRLAALVDPTSPHISSSLDSDGCASCHSAHRATNEPLISNVYRVDPLRSSTEPYDGGDFGLCLTCHQESPFADVSGSANPLTNFAGHGFHLGLIEEDGTGGRDILVPGDGQGNALCAECHYNLHGVPASERGLVAFAPDVVPFGGQLTFDAAAGSCTLTCHGREHDGLSFQAAQPGT